MNNIINIITSRFHCVLVKFIHVAQQTFFYFQTPANLLFVLFTPLATSAALPNAGQVMRDLEETRLNIPAPVEVKPSPPEDAPISL